MIPDSLPVISRGTHVSPAEGACVMEYVSMLAGEPFSDYPTCTHRALAEAAQLANDSLPDERRHEMVSRINRLFGTNTAVGEEAKRISVGLAQFSAEHAKKSAASYAAAAGSASASASYAAAAGSASASASAAASAAAAAAGAASYAAAYASAAAAAAGAAGVGGVGAAGSAARLHFLDELLDEYDRLTGRTSVEDVLCKLPSVLDKVGA